MGSKKIIEGVRLTPQRIINVDGGDVLHAMKSSDPEYRGFGEAYFSFIQPNFIKAWKMHKKMTLNLIVPIGAVRFVLISDKNDINDESNFIEFILSPENYSRLTIPPKVWVGFQGLSDKKSMLLNLADLSHNQNEVDRKEIDEIPFNWSN